MAGQRDYYDVLGVNRQATAEQIRSAYRKLARQYHPDVNKSPDAAKRFSEMQEAYDVLSDAEKRKSYDRFGHAGVGANIPHGGHRQTVWSNVGTGGAEDIDLGSIFEDVFGRGAASGASPFQSGFSRGGRRTHGAQSRQKGSDIEHKLSVSFITAALGGTEHVRLGSGGSSSTISVKIPPGTDTGTKLRVKGKGQPGIGGGSQGDLILSVEVGQHPFYKREGLDILIDVPLTIAEAALGTVVTVPILGGDQSIDLKVPPGVSSGRRLRVKGKGIDNKKGRVGDFFAIVQIVAPEAASLSSDAQKALSKLAKELKNPRESSPWTET